MHMPECRHKTHDRNCEALELRAELEHVKACITCSYDCTWGTTEANPEHTCTRMGQPCVVKQLELVKGELSLARAAKAPPTITWTGFDDPNWL